MPSLKINGVDVEYSESQVLTFPEGLIGLPDVRRAALIPLKELEPFCWLSSIDERPAHFVVVDPSAVFSNYQAVSVAGPEAESLQTLAIVKVASDWSKTTVNLRAPIVVNRETKRGAQVILSESSYQFDETLVQN